MLIQTLFYIFSNKMNIFFMPGLRFAFPDPPWGEPSTGSNRKVHIRTGLENTKRPPSVLSG